MKLKPSTLRQVLWPSTLLFALIFSITTAAHFPHMEGGRASLLSEIWPQKEPVPEINLLMTGDIMLDRYIATLRGRAIADTDPANDLFPFTFMPKIIDAVETQLATSQLDLVLGNLEGPITDSNYVNDGTAMIFNFKPSVVEQLKNAGFTTFTLANNHTLDMGKDGPQKTHEYLAAGGLDSFGHPDTLNGDFSFLSYELNGIKLGFLGLNDAVIKLDIPAAVRKIQEVDTQVDVLIVAIHWGFEYEATARESVVNKAHQFVDAGADFIWGHHPHVVQNSELYKDKHIYYSLGNFVFDQYWSTETQKGLVLGLKILKNEEGGFTLTPVEVPVDLVKQGEPTPASQPQ
ncbi:CapA family protein [Candidatus Peregrinibacteria bacterium]|nr:MAG: CapA family protein [Candidatus Peregrinibacteria bacterium]